MSILTLAGHILVSENDLAAVLNELPNHIALSRKEEGCLLFSVTQDENDRCQFNVYEEFQDKASFEVHQDRVKASVWGGLTKNAVRSYKLGEK